MADEEQVRILRLGSEAWNNWRRKHESISIDLSHADLSGTDLSGADLSGLSGANLSGAILGADLRGTNLSGANLSGANLVEAFLHGANLVGANLNGAYLAGNVTVANLSGANLSGAYLIGVDLSGANLVEAFLHGANLVGANLNGAYLAGNVTVANLSGANLSGAYLIGVDLSGANLSGAELSGAEISRTNLTRTNLSGANFSGYLRASAILNETVFSDLDLSGCTGLESCVHQGPSTIDIRTLQRSGPLPLAFLRGVGLPDALIEYLPSLLGRAIQHYSCFISYASKDEEFVRRLHADLQDKGVRCWIAPEDMKWGSKILDTLDEAIRLRDKVLLVLSEASIASDWVEFEVKKAFAEERQRGTTVLFPVRIDDAVFTTNEAWAIMLRDDRNIGDFRSWKDHDAYQTALDRVLRDLRVETKLT